MRLRNISNGPVYESITASEITTGKTTTDINILKEALHKILHDTRFEPLITDDEKAKINQLLEASEKAKTRNIKDLPGYDDPYGMKAIEERCHANEEAVKAARRELVRRANERKERFKDLVIKDEVKDLVPKKVDGTPKSLKDIAQHNEAIRRDNNG